MGYDALHFDQNGISWKCEIYYVDQETGEQLTIRNATNKDKYIIIKTIKDATTFNKNRTRATITYTKICRKQPQGKLF